MLDPTTQTQFEAKGSLVTPGPIGRLIRFAIGVALFNMAYPMILNAGVLINNGIPLFTSNIVSILIMFWVFPYVINIGWGLNTRRVPQMALIAATIILGAYDYMSGGMFYGGSLKLFTLTWVFYTAVHLGISMVLAAVLATPGCEMRSIPQLWGIITRRQSKEHYCPGFLNRLDRWERGSDSSSKMQK